MINREQPGTTKWVKVYNATHLAEAEMIKAIFESEGICARVNDLEIGVLAQPIMDSKGYDVLTPVEQAEIARTFLASERGPDWVCPRCKEKIDGAFDVCWKCGRERDEAWVSS